MIEMIKSQIFPGLRDAVVTVAICTAVAPIVNAIRPDGIPFIQKSNYEIFVPCPEPMGEAKVMSPFALYNTEGENFIVDARSKQEYDTWHYPGAINIHFDYLFPVGTCSLKKIASSGAKMVIVYGDGLDPDSGEELAKELSGNGIKNIFYIEGGAPLIKRDLN